MSAERSPAWHVSLLTILMVALAGPSGATQADEATMPKRKQHHAAPLSAYGRVEPPAVEVTVTPRPLTIDIRPE